jgi:uncharacterized membrane protein YfcA
VGAFLGNTLTFDPPVLLMLQFVISIYGGYFGGAVGLIMMAMWGLLTANIDVKAMGPARTLLVSAANGAAVFLFIIAGIVRWPEALAVLFGAVAGGYTGARFARWLPRFAVRICVLWLGSAVTVVFFLRAFGPR